MNKYITIISRQEWQATGDEFLRCYRFTYDGQNRLKEAVYAEREAMDKHENRYNELVRQYTKNGNIRYFHRRGHKNDFIYGKVDNLEMKYDGNRLISVKDDANNTTGYGAFDFHDRANAEVEYTYNGVGALTGDLNRGIASITYDNLNCPRRILFSNGSSIDYVYAADGTKLRAVYTTVTNGVTVGRDSTDYRGELILRNSQMEKFLFSGGYATINGGTPTFHYYTQDHLGNNRAVVNESGTVEQVTHYYPFGGVFDDASTGQSLQPYKYNGKELDRMHGLDTYDYGARQYYAPVMRWDRVDPLAEKYYHISPYVYCGNNPIFYFDPDGRDGMLTGSGTKEDPFIITATYFYKIGTLSKAQIEGLNSAIESYNNSGGKYGTKIKNSDKTISYIKYNLSAIGVDNIEQARLKTGFETVSGDYRYYGNIVGLNSNGGDEYGSGNNNRIDFNTDNITKGIKDYNMSPKELNKGVAIHEIGHNIGGEHSDGTSVMRSVQTTQSPNGIYTNYPSLSNDFTHIIFKRHDTPKKERSDGRIWTKK